MASIRQIKYSKPYNLEYMIVSIWGKQEVTEAVADENNWKSKQDKLNECRTYLHDDEERHTEYLNNTSLEDVDKGKRYRSFKGLLAYKNIAENSKIEFQNEIDKIEQHTSPELLEQYNKEITYYQKEKELEHLEKYGIYEFSYEQAKSIFDVYNKIKGDSTKEAKFKELYALMSDMNSAEWAYDGEQNKTLLNEKDGVQTLRINNLGGSGLNLAIKDDMSFIFEKDGTLTDWQVASFAKFFDDHGMTPESFEGVKDLKVTNAKGEEIGTFEQVYTSYTDCSQYNGKSAEELCEMPLFVQ